MGDFDANQLKKKLLRNVTKANRKSYARLHESMYMGTGVVARKLG